MRRIAFYGGSFNPAHCGHQSTILYALETANVDNVIVAPVYQHPYGKELAPFNDRIAMCHHMVTPFAPGKVHVSRLEEVSFARNGKGELGKGLTSEALRLLRGFDLGRDIYPVGSDDTIVLVMGDDLKQDIENWEGYDYLSAEADARRLEFFFVARATDLSSTKVRRYIAEDRPYRRLVPKGVYEYLEQCPDLYKK